MGDQEPEFAIVSKLCGDLLAQEASRRFPPIERSLSMMSSAAVMVAANRNVPAPARRLNTMIASASESEDDDLLRSLSSKETTPLSLRDLHAFCASPDAAAREQQAQFLHRELPIRFAQRVIELQNLPYGLSDTKPVKEAAGWYARIMHSMQECPVPKGELGEARFTSFLASLVLDHTCIPQALSKGVLELSERVDVGIVQRHRMDRVLDNFFISRISMRFLVENFIASKNNRPGFSGVIETECSPLEVASKAAADVDRLCRAHIGDCPEIQLLGRPEDTFTTVTCHLYYILYELLKNSCRATVEHSRSKNGPGAPLPPVRMIVTRGKEEVTIKVMDEGGGIRRSDLQHVWSYMYSTAPRPSPDQLGGVPLEEMSGVMSSGSTSGIEEKYAFAGYGMGLPLSRLYARYFGGSLKLRPMEGYGTDAYLHMHRLKTNSEESLPTALGETLRVMSDDGRVLASASRSWDLPASDDSKARALIRSLGKGL
ncbi:unnamed protein product [Choristocarpus tenellus]